jgi:hypothetical protein
VSRNPYAPGGNKECIGQPGMQTSNGRASGSRTCPSQQVLMVREAVAGLYQHSIARCGSCGAVERVPAQRCGKEGLLGLLCCLTTGPEAKLTTA